jgi:hypothetical protein
MTEIWVQLESLDGSIATQTKLSGPSFSPPAIRYQDRLFLRKGIQRADHGYRQIYQECIVYELKGCTEKSGR